MAEPSPDTASDHPELVGYYTTENRLRMGEPDGDAGEWVSADATIPMDEAR